MDKFINRNSMLEQVPLAEETISHSNQQNCLEQKNVKVNLYNVGTDNGLQIKILYYLLNNWDEFI